MKIFQKCNKVLGHIPVEPKKKKKKENGILAVFKSLSTFTHRVSGQRCHFLSAAALPLLPPVFLSSPPHRTSHEDGHRAPLSKQHKQDISTKGKRNGISGDAAKKTPRFMNVRSRRNRS